MPWMNDPKFHRYGIFFLFVFFAILSFSLSGYADVETSGFTLARYQENDETLSPTPVEVRHAINWELHYLLSTERTEPYVCPSLSSQIMSPNQITRYYEKRNRKQRLEDSLFTASSMTLIALNVADYISTKQALKYDILQEANPFMKPFAKSNLAFAAVKVGLTIGNHYLMRSMFRRHKKTAWILNLVSNAIMTAIVVNNFSQIHKARHAYGI